ncbi:hypothetical protein [Flavivirga eckloniae]|uniref:Uncharacterized protein n=1 Tax=Flavivirga eckloniae TaxID=1803846 RepID=A0A2K9PNL9_9FLAO|nr:hypothetical protein [Flavivirga eckloniae]AUP78663.1 hypothetical protein C1H87_08060 [Flavivirga eckloniae]
MKRSLLILFIIILSINAYGQKIIHKPDYIYGNVSGKVEKVELTEKETILHFHLKKPRGGWVYIPSETYIENSLTNEGRLYVIKGEEVGVGEKYYLSRTNEIIYKLYFPALGKDVKKINYGESNLKGNRFIYKLDVSKNGYRFKSDRWHNTREYISSKKKSSINNKDKQLREVKTVKTDGDIFPKDLPKDFFGNWYDKYGTLILITTPDYVVSDFRIRYYVDIQKIGNNKFKIETTANTFEILSLDNENMIIRTDKLTNLKRKPDTNVPEFIKGHWINKNGKGKLTVSENLFFFHKTPENILSNEKKYIDHVAVSKSDDAIWFILYDQGKFNMYIANKINGNYVLGPRGHMETQYKKIK